MSSAAAYHREVAYDPQTTTPTRAGATMATIDVEQAVRTFMEACGQGVDRGKHAQDLRIALIDEEFTELIEAINHGDRTHILKELCDLVYVAVGTAIAMGLPFNDGFAALQVSNMSKIGADGKIHFREDGKVLKGPSYIDAEEAISELLRW